MTAHHSTAAGAALNRPLIGMEKHFSPDFTSFIDPPRKCSQEAYKRLFNKLFSFNTFIYLLSKF